MVTVGLIAELWQSLTLLTLLHSQTLLHSHKFQKLGLRCRGAAYKILGRDVLTVGLIAQSVGRA